ncbi:MAG: aldo/keto reductase [Chloroflexi bacterium]|nr:aldo/keto reductase [Chloroflexota bacterium]
MGYVPDGFDFSFDATLRSVHDSLSRLGLERITLVQVHELRPETWDAVMAPGRALAALRRLQVEGLVGHVGVTSSERETLARAIDSGEFETVLLWKHYHLLDRSGEAILRLAVEQGLGLIVGTAFAGGILATGAGPGAKFFYRDAPAAERDRAARLEATCARFGVPLASAALQFCLRSAGVTTVIAGADRPEHVERNVAALTTPIPEALWPELLSD